VLLDTTEGRRYVEPVKGNDLDNMYNMTTQMDEYVNSIAEGVLIWRSISSCTLDLEEALENWKQRLHEVSTRKCDRITCVLRWIGIELCEPPRYDGLIDVVSFI